MHILEVKSILLGFVGSGYIFLYTWDLYLNTGSWKSKIHLARVRQGCHFSKALWVGNPGFQI